MLGRTHIEAAAQRLGWLWYWLRASPDEKRLPPPWLRDVGPGDFEAIGREFATLLERFAGLTASSHLLDVGCGSGRLAIALTDRISPDGRYLGIDVVRRSIRWCRRRVTPVFPNFSFLHADVRNSRYNPHGTIPASHLRFPAHDDTFDVVALVSVFTHMLPEDQAHYLKEASRVLKSSGRLFATYFLWSADRPVPAPLIDFRYRRAGHRVRDEDVPESAVATDESLVVELLEEAALELAAPIRAGYWRGDRDRATGDVTLQDVVIARPRPSPERA